MATYAPTHADHRLGGDRSILIALAILVAAAVAVAAGLLVDWSFVGGDSTDAVDTSGASYETLDHAARVSNAARELHALQNVAVSVPLLAPGLAEDIAMLELVTTGQLPVEASERAMPVETTRPDAMTGPDLRIEQVQPETRTGPDLRIDLDG